MPNSPVPDSPAPNSPVRNSSLPHSPQPSQTVEDHYRRPGVAERIRDRLIQCGLRLEDVNSETLAGADEFHLGGRVATESLVDSLELNPDSRILDVGCGIGGAARTIASRRRCNVVGVDLTPEFVEAARSLSDLVGLTDLTTFSVGNALSLTVEADEFDVATMFHVGMNVADKTALFAEIGRVLRPGGRLMVYDIMRIGAGEIEFPVPWSSHSATSHVVRPADYVAALSAAGFVASEPINRMGFLKRALSEAAERPPPLNLSDLMGGDWPTMFGNLKRALDAGTVSPTEIVARLAS